MVTALARIEGHCHGTQLGRPITTKLEDIEGVHHADDAIQRSIVHRGTAELRGREFLGDRARGGGHADRENLVAWNHHVDDGLFAERHDAGDDLHFLALADALQLSFAKELVDGVAHRRMVRRGGAVERSAHDAPCPDHRRGDDRRRLEQRRQRGGKGRCESASEGARQQLPDDDDECGESCEPERQLARLPRVVHREQCPAEHDDEGDARAGRDDQSLWPFQVDQCGA